MHTKLSRRPVIDILDPQACDLGIQCVSLQVYNLTHECHTRLTLNLRYIPPVILDLLFLCDYLVDKKIYKEWNISDYWSLLYVKPVNIIFRTMCT